MRNLLLVVLFLWCLCPRNNFSFRSSRFRVNAFFFRLRHSQWFRRYDAGNTTPRTRNRRQQCFLACCMLMIQLGTLFNKMSILNWWWFLSCCINNVVCCWLKGWRSFRRGFQFGLPIIKRERRWLWGNASIVIAGMDVEGCSNSKADISMLSRECLSEKSPSSLLSCDNDASVEELLEVGDLE